MDKTQKTQNEIEQVRLNKLIGKVIYGALIIILVLVFGALGNVLGMQKDTLDTINLQQQQINDLNNKITNMDILYQTEQKNVSAVQKVPLTTSERELIERVCMAEAGSDISGCMAVSQVIHNRAVLWDMTPYEVVTQKDQFTEPYKGEISAEAVQAVWAVFDEGMKAFEDNNVTHFYAEDSQEPYWIVNKDFVGEMGGNLFYESRY